MFSFISQALINFKNRKSVLFFLKYLIAGCHIVSDTFRNFCILLIQLKILDIKLSTFTPDAYLFCQKFSKVASRACKSFLSIDIETCSSVNCWKFDWKSAVLITFVTDATTQPMALCSNSRKRYYQNIEKTLDDQYQLWKLNNMSIVHANIFKLYEVFFTLFQMFCNFNL